MRQISVISLKYVIHISLNSTTNFKISLQVSNLNKTVKKCNIFFDFSYSRVQRPERNPGSFVISC
jgi:hypothetical protein